MADVTLPRMLATDVDRLRDASAIVAVIALGTSPAGARPVLATIKRVRTSR